MMRRMVLLLVVLLALPSLAFASAQEKEGKDEPYLRAKIIDTDPMGTNMRDAPKGKITYNVPLHPKDDLERLVDVHEQRGDWFRVTNAGNGRGGWMHSSVLGLRGGAAEDGPCPLKRSPAEEAATIVTPAEGAVLQLLGFTEARDGVWIMVRYTDAKGKKHEGWIPQQCE